MDNAKRLCQLLVSNTRGLVLEDIPKDDRRKVLIYSEKLQAAESTSWLEAFTKGCDRTKVDLYLSCDAADVDSNKKSAYPMLRDNTVFGVTDRVRYSSCGKVVLEMYKKGILTLSGAMEYLKFDYAVERKRAYGEADFDMIVTYEVNDVDRLLTLCTFDKEAVVFVQESMLAMAEQGDQRMKDALAFCAQDTNIHLAAIDQAIVERLAKVLPQEVCEKIDVVPDNAKLAEWVLNGEQAKA
jgi:hypothetical protein